MTKVITTSPPSKLIVPFNVNISTSNLTTGGVPRTTNSASDNTGGVMAGVVIVLLILAAVIVVGIIVGVYFWR